MDNREVAVHEFNAPALTEMSIAEMRSQVQKIQLLMSELMHKDEHYGVIPGTNKPTLLKPGAEKLCLMFRLDPQYEVERERDGEHLTITSRCTLYHINTGVRMGSGMGSCSTRESKYAWRKAERTCPSCGKPAIIKGQAKYGGGWVCWKKKDGCGEKYEDGDTDIESQEVGRIPNPDIADQYNTVLKMANKRSLVAAVLNVTAASDCFTQDLEDTQDPAGSEGASAEKPTISPDAGNAAPPSGGDDKRTQAELILDATKQKPSDKATPQQRAGLWRSCLRVFGDSREGAEAWLHGQFDAEGISKADEMTKEMLKNITARLIEVEHHPQPEHVEGDIEW